MTAKVPDSRTVRRTGSERLEATGEFNVSRSRSDRVSASNRLMPGLHLERACKARANTLRWEGRQARRAAQRVETYRGRCRNLPAVFGRAGFGIEKTQLFVKRIVQDKIDDTHRRDGLRDFRSTK